MNHLGQQSSGQRPPMGQQPMGQQPMGQQPMGQRPARHGDRRMTAMWGLVVVLAGVAVGMGGWLAPGCQEQSKDGEATAALTRELSQVNEELAAQRARIDGLVDRLDRLESLASNAPESGLAAPSLDSGSDPIAGDGTSGRPSVALPSVASDPGGDVPPLIVAVGKRSLSLAGEKIDRGALGDRLNAHATAHPRAAVVLRVASGVSSGRMNEIADMAREQGITQIAVVREGTAKKSRKKRRKRR